jgi:hypothetical protein
LITLDIRKRLLRLLGLASRRLFCGHSVLDWHSTEPAHDLQYIRPRTALLIALSHAATSFDEQRTISRLDIESIGFVARAGPHLACNLRARHPLGLPAE